MLVNVTIIFINVVYALFNVTGTAIIKYSLLNYQLQGLLSYVYFVLQPKVIFGLALNFMSMLIILKALSLGRFSFVFPVAIGIHFILTMTLGFFIFGDKMNLFSILGVMFIFIGIFFMSIANGYN